ncbi:MAG: thioesterase family protein, partial [Oligoflexia bacterium]|nr:thioesterase family protein [Oligoflexia bacterium]
VSSRNLYLRHVLHTTLDDFKERGFGVFMRKATTEFLKPVLPHERIHIRSWVREVRNTSFFIEFEMLSGDQKDVHARGELLIVWMDLATGKPCGFPDWAHRYFFKPLPA